MIRIFTFETILFREFLTMKTKFSYFPGMLENPAAVVKTSCKQNIQKKNIL